ncbi:pectinesterase QRT1 [Cornus florida]|uniref:pectinesterase QRT1 n=1 Tax=Cornus florida TaxID=4283 RepID=UPI002896DA8C|nr:pectinesterase QRT1 [Cornus florida]
MVAKNLIVFSVCVVGLLAFFGEFELGGSEEDVYKRNFITWDDVKVDENKVRMGLSDEDDDYYQSGVILVVKNGMGDSVTVQGAVDMVPQYNSQRVKIYILPGIYREKVLIPITKPYISFIGDQNRASETVITWNNKASDKDEHGHELGTSRSASVTVESDYFCATGLTFQNSIVAKAGDNGRQAVALRIAGNKAMFYKVRILGSQDTLLDDYGSHYFYHSYIEGAIDFIFGSSRSLYQDCVLHSTAKTFGAIAAHRRDSANDDTGFSFVNCTINGTGTLYLGRAWGNYSRTIYSYCDIDNIITPSGWTDWDNPSRQRSAVFGEYKCRGRGANRRDRVPWLKSFSYEEVKPFLDRTFIGGEQWLRL